MTSSRGSANKKTMRLSSKKNPQQLHQQMKTLSWQTVKHREADVGSHNLNTTFVRYDKFTGQGQRSD